MFQLISAWPDVGLLHHSSTLLTWIAAQRRGLVSLGAPTNLSLFLLVVNTKDFTCRLRISFTTEFSRLKLRADDVCRLRGR